ncbi:MAG TPA: hypothetical protein VH325_16855 [Bryobacteraceae bacterium]|jgi:hypothetical protein|nr:hypothetical protein [Bryobacteraceae bacterium]
MAMNVGSMSVTDRLAEVLKRSKKNFGPDVGQQIDALLSPVNLAILAGTLVVWAGSHFFGVGEIVDVLLLVVGAFAIGWSIGDVATDLYNFADLTINAKSENDLDKAAQAFSHAVVLAGITVIMAILLRRSVKEIQVTRGPNVSDAIRLRNSPGLPPVGNDPAAGRIWSKPGISTDPTLPAGDGSTSPWGEVRLSPAGSATDQALARAHELVHRFLTPRFGVLRQFRVQVGMAGYLRSMLLQYLEEALAETIAQLRVNGFTGLLDGLKFPVKNGYMLVSDLVSEGEAIGTITIGSQFFTVQFIPANHDPETTANACYVENACRN